MARRRGPWPGGETQGDVHSISPNGSVRSEGFPNEAYPWMNPPRNERFGTFNMDTGSTSAPLLRDKPRSNRTGEGR